MTSVTFFCHSCQTHRAVEIEPVSADELNPEPWGDIVCAVCGFVIATISGPAGVYRVCRVGDGSLDVNLTGKPLFDQLTKDDRQID